MSVGAFRATLTITAIAIVSSVLIAGLVVHLIANGEVPAGEWLLAAVLVPSIIGPIVGGIVISMAYELSEAKAALAEAALTDPLTGISNRRFFMQQAELEIARAHRHNMTLSIITIDIDHFKNVNDSYGHGVGDRVLCDVASACKDALRSTDLFARFGGEEFIALLPMTDSPAASVLAETLRQRVADLRFGANGPKNGVTVSLGIASLPTDGATLRDILDEADRQLYLAKNSGRDRIKVAGRLAAKAA